MDSQARLGDCFCLRLVCFLERICGASATNSKSSAAVQMVSCVPGGTRHPRLGETRPKSSTLYNQVESYWPLYVTWSLAVEAATPPSGAGMVVHQSATLHFPLTSGHSSADCRAEAGAPPQSPTLLEAIFCISTHSRSLQPFCSSLKASPDMVRCLKEKWPNHGYWG